MQTKHECGVCSVVDVDCNTLHTDPEFKQPCVS